MVCIYNRIYHHTIIVVINTYNSSIEHQDHSLLQKKLKIMDLKCSDKFNIMMTKEIKNIFLINLFTDQSMSFKCYKGLNSMIHFSVNEMIGD